MKEFLDVIRKNSGGYLTGAQDWVVLGMVIVGALLVIASVVALAISLWLAWRYIKFNHRENSCGMTGEKIARQVLDQNGLQDIRVSKNGSILFGNSYSHFFHKVRLRRLTWQKKSISSMAMAVQKSSLAVLDQKGDQNMRWRIALTPVTYFGPLAFLPLIVIGLLLDLLILNTGTGICTILCTGIGVLFYLISFVMAMMVLKTEKKAQTLALEIMREQNLATDEEVTMCKDLFHLYNVEYVNNMVIALLELVYYVLQIIGSVQSGSLKGDNN